jgi:hypothetical protein
MAQLAPMPVIEIEPAQLIPFGNTWSANNGDLTRTPPYSSSELGRLFDAAVANAVATMLGNIPIVVPNAYHLIPPQADCIELGSTRIIGGVRPQNFDVGYRPDSVRYRWRQHTRCATKDYRRTQTNTPTRLS